VLLRLSYLALTNVFGFMRLLPMSDTHKDVEILALRHQLWLARSERSAPGPATVYSGRRSRATRTALPSHRLVHAFPVWRPAARS
jgi:hypothetical protein